jgi:DNA gyrase subunit A
VVLNQLFRFTPMQTSFGCNMLALNGGRPEQLTLRDFLTAFIDLPRGGRRAAHGL